MLIFDEFMLALFRGQCIDKNQSGTLLRFLQGFRERVLPNIQHVLGADSIRSVHESGADLRTHLINAREYLLSVSTLDLKNLAFDLHLINVT